MKLAADELGMYISFPKRIALFCLLSVAPVVIGCGNIREGLATSRLLAAISVAPSPALASLGQSVPLTATGFYSDGTSASLTSLVTWSVPPQMGSITPAGVLRCDKAGVFAITAAMQGVTVSTSVQCSEPAELAGVALRISPQPVSLSGSASTQMQLVEVLSDSYQANVTGMAQWATEGSVASVDASGIVTCLKSGQDLVTAAYNGSYIQDQVTCDLGTTGNQGATGTTGTTGNQGTTGTTGTTGSQGTTGTTGTTGSQGATGTTGTTGSQAGTGTTSTTGSQGATGTTGTTGSQAGTGTTSTTGSQGATGTTGMTGSQGTTGTTGTTGSQGATGTTGTTGSQAGTGNPTTNGTQSTDAALVLTLPGTRTPVGYSITATLRTSAAVAGQDMSSQAIWSITPADHASVSSGTIKCLQAGDVIVTATYDSTTVTAPLTCAPMNYHHATQFIEQGDEFSGPFNNWLNVKQLGAVGDGIADDTQAIQNGLDQIVPATTGIRVLYLPAGVYRITAPLHLVQASFVNVVGADPASTKIVWDGPIGGTLFDLNGSDIVRLIRLTFDGASKATSALTLDKTTSGGNYSTGIQLSDLHLMGVAIGLNLQITAETDIERIFFDGNTQECIQLGDANNINIFIRDSLFSHCGTGISNVHGSGVFNVSDSYFDHSVVADMHIQNTGFFAARRDTSIGSGSFFLSELAGANNAQITLQGNTVIDPLSTPVVLGNTGPLVLIDNVFRMLDETAPVITAYDGRSPSDPVTQNSAAFLFGNIYSSAHPVGDFDGNVIAYDDATVDASSIPTPSVPSNVYTPPALGRQVFEVPINSSDVEIQAAIDAATASHAVRPIVHLPQSGYTINNPLLFPPGSDIQLIGDGENITKLYWYGPASGSIISLPSTHTKLSNFTLTTYRSQYGDRVLPAAGALDGLSYTIDDQPSDRIIADQLQLEESNLQSFFSDGIEHATTDLYATYMLGLQNGISVTGGSFRASGQATLGKTDYLTGSIQSLGSATSLSVSLGGRLLVQDNWHDADASTPHNYELSGSGTLTEQGGAAYMTADPSFVLNNFQGDVTMMSMSVVGGFSMPNTSSATNLLTLGMAGTSANFAPTAGSSPSTTASVVNGFYHGVYSQLPSDNPDASWMRRMLGQVRAENPVPLGSTALSSMARLDRVEVIGMSNAVHVRQNGQHQGLYMTIGGADGSIVGAGGQCVTQVAGSSGSDSQFVLTPGQEGDFILSPINHPELAATASVVDGMSEVLMLPTTSSYNQHWMVQMGQSGLYQFVNRGTAKALKSSGASTGCLTLTGDVNDAQTYWNVQVH